MQRLTLVGAGKVDDGGGAAPQRRPGAAGKVIRRGGVAHVQIEMGVGIDEAGKQQHPGHVHHLCADGGNIAADIEDLLALHQDIGPAGALAGDHGTALEQQSHHKTSSFVLISVGIIPLFPAAHNIKKDRISCLAGGIIKHKKRKAQWAFLFFEFN